MLKECSCCSFTRKEFFVISLSSFATAFVLLLCAIVGSGAWVPSWAQFDFRADSWALDRLERRIFNLK